MTTLPSRPSGKPTGMRHAPAVRIRGLLALAALGATLVATPAHASKTFVPNMKQRWNITSLPVSGEGCLLCHKTNDGKAGTIDKPFGKTMQALGLKQLRVDLLIKALDTVRQRATTKPIIDSDGDKVADYTEIVFDRTNPNDAKSVHVVPPPPPPMGGEGGEGGQGNVPGAGATPGEGGTGALEPSGPAPYSPPTDLPPPFEHGCSLTPRRSEPYSALMSALTALSLAACAVRRRNRRP